MWSVCGLSAADVGAARRPAKAVSQAAGQRPDPGISVEQAGAWVPGHLQSIEGRKRRADEDLQRKFGNSKDWVVTRVLVLAKYVLWPR
jgi:hypothetical protein